MVGGKETRKQSAGCITKFNLGRTLAEWLERTGPFVTRKARAIENAFRSGRRTRNGERQNRPIKS